MATLINAEERSILAPAMTVQAMRDSRYRHPANAVAELIDNSIDAHAGQVDILIQEHRVRVNNNDLWRLHSLAVLDNGDGMSEETLGQAIRFGGRVQGPGIRKIGKYGMGLPTASASQCKRLDVWTWQDGIANAYHAYLDINEVQAGKQQLIATDPQSPPPEWLSRANIDVSDHGTLVVWSDIDRIKNQAETIFRHLADEIGRTYRHCINEKDVVIRMAAFRGHVRHTQGRHRHQGASQRPTLPDVTFKYARAMGPCSFVRRHAGHAGDLHSHGKRQGRNH